MIRWVPDPTPEVTRAHVALAERAVGLHADRPLLWVGLARALEKAGRFADAADRMSEAEARFPGHPRVILELARAQLLQGAFAGGLETVGRLPDDDEAGARLAFELAVRLSRWPAEGAAARIERLDPTDGWLLVHRNRQFARRPELIVEACDRLLALRPGHTDALHFKALALDRLGRAAEARALMSLEAFTTVVPPSAARGRPCLEALRGEILANRTLRPDPAGHATRQGVQTTRLVAADTPALVALRQEIMRAVDAYVAALTGDHPFVAARPAAARLNAWAVILGGQGRQASHRHPAGWLSGVFYVDAPAATDGPRPGALRLGARDDDAPPAWGVREVEPEPGTLVLFPSYVPHATAPTGSEALRISVAFDVIPVDEPP